MSPPLGNISEIFIYPIKSLQGIKLESAVVTRYGLAHPDNTEIIDRKWMIVDENGSFLTQRQIPKMALISISVDLAKNSLILAAPNKKDKLSIPVSFNGSIKNCRVWNSRIDGYTYESRSIGKWLDDVLEQENLSLISFDTIDLIPRRVKTAEEKGCKARDNDVVIYSDYSPLMLISESSLDDLNLRLENKVTFRHFRPNLIAKNVSNSYAEDEWSKIKIGNAKMFKIKNCTRCLLTTVLPDLGIKDANQEPLKTLKTYRTDNEKYGQSPIFGINLAVDNEGEIIRVNDEIIEEL